MHGEYIKDSDLAPVKKKGSLRLLQSPTDLTTLSNRADQFGGTGTNPLRHSEGQRSPPICSSFANKTLTPRLPFSCRTGHTDTIDLTA
ncbi:hypothetical protein AALO_G00248720 [Alosa alosa]|uniref:Uncharacterized protein n=1 Tax=Alosa alosa TaxID=278164 RepID=A0AAV6FXU1_9TELE|nr:hypothetical protein AALO_G00248720 [Alosa alosa]